ncbi:MAG: helicase, partial [Pseudomonadota bacterium]|nr:helicase [Pseudomonadota bacterium]
MNLPARSALSTRRIQGVTAVLGPTNTGKTHLAIERMLAHESGVIGLPLRLLAREVYARVVERAGESAVALVTGEEKIKPPNPRYWVCTVEAMPREVDASFLAVDEIQLAADLERGHVFTDRILHARGRDETLLLGAATMRPLVEQLLPGVSVVTRPRLSTLAYAGEKKITRLPRRAAIVAFSAEDVYGIAELIRRQRGGAAVVLGALSPRTRNAQVALYQSGDVDFLVATDAIGMGLNLDVDHVAFAATRKFDGFHFRNLSPAELGQVAGRAGRYTRDGTFGVTGQVDGFQPELVRALEAHDFEPLKVLQWRNSDLDFASLDALRRSLSETPREPGLTRAPIGEDLAVLEIAARDDDMRAYARSPAAVRRLWETCQIPDYRKIAPANHADLVLAVFGFLMEQGAIPTDWFARQVAYADRTDGDIDTLSNRIAHVRTWTFVANRADWLEDPAHWQGVTRAVEDKLSDALHERLTQRFVDRRTSTLMRRLRENAMLEAEITPTGDVLVEGHHVGRLDGFRFAPDASAEAVHGRALRAAAQKALAAEIETRAARLAAAPDQAFILAGNGLIRWEGQPVAQLTPGDRALGPQVRLLADEQLTGGARDRVHERLDTFVRHHIATLLRPLLELEKSEGLEGFARGLAYQIVEGLGTVERSRVADELRQLDQEARAKLRAFGVRFGAYHVYVPQLLKPAPRGLVALLWALKREGAEAAGLDELPALAASGRTSFPVDAAVNKGLYRAVGYRVCGTRAVRIDILERLADLIRPALAWREGAGMRPDAAVPGGFRVTPSMTSLLGCSAEEVGVVLKALGYRSEKRRLAKAVLAPPQP